MNFFFVPLTSENILSHHSRSWCTIVICNQSPLRIQRLPECEKEENIRCHMSMTQNIQSMKGICAFFCLLVVAQQRPMSNSGSTGKDQLESAVIQWVQSDLAFERFEMKKRKKKRSRGKGGILSKTPLRPYRHLRHQDSSRSSRTCNFQIGRIFKAS